MGLVTLSMISQSVSHSGGLNKVILVKSKCAMLGTELTTKHLLPCHFTDETTFIQKDQMTVSRLTLLGIDKTGISGNGILTTETI